MCSAEGAADSRSLLLATINRIVDTAEEIRSKLVIPGELHLMIHGCHSDFPNSAYLSVD